MPGAAAVVAAAFLLLPGYVVLWQHLGSEHIARMSSTDLLLRSALFSFALNAITAGLVLAPAYKSALTLLAALLAAFLVHPTVIDLKVLANGIRFATEAAGVYLVLLSVTTGLACLALRHHRRIKYAFRRVWHRAHRWRRGIPGAPPSNISPATSRTPPLPQEPPITGENGPTS